MATVITVVTTCYCCKGTWLVETQKKTERKYAEICHRSGGVLEKLKLIVIAAPCWAWLLIATMMT